MTELPFVNRGEPHARGVAPPSGKVRAASDLAKNAKISANVPPRVKAPTG